MYNSQEIALKIKETAKIKKISIKQLLEKCDLNINYISELGKGKQASALNIGKIADCLEVSTDYLLGRTQESQSFINNNDSSKLVDYSNQVIGNEFIGNGNSLNKCEDEITNYLRKLTVSECRHAVADVMDLLEQNYPIKKKV